LPVAGADIDLDNGQALCRPCGEPFRLPESPPAALVPASTAAVVYRPTDLPLREHREGGDFQLALRATPVNGAAVGSVSPASNAGTWLWGVRALTASGQSVLLPLELGSEEHARYLAARLERELEQARAPRSYRS
jgi:hypothetical protein